MSLFLFHLIVIIMLAVGEEAHILEKLVTHIFPFLIYCVILLSLHLSYSLQEHLMRAERTWLKQTSLLFPLSSLFGFHPLSFWFLISPEDKGRGWLDAVPDSQGAMWPSMSSLTVPLHVQRRICLTSPDVSKIQMSASRLCAWSSLSTKRKKQAWIKCHLPHPR